MAIKVQANTGSLYEIMVDPSIARASRKPAFRAGWAEAPAPIALVIGGKADVARTCQYVR